MQGLAQQGQPKRNRMFPDSNARRSHRITRIFHHSTFLFGWLKTQLKWREYSEEDELYEILDEILTGVSIELIETIFVDWMNRLQQLIDGNGDYVSYNLASKFLN
jgi:hypothetical protein